MHYSRRLLTALIAATISTPLTQAEDTDKDAKHLASTPPKVSIIALGPKPERRYKMPNAKENQKLQEKMEEMIASDRKLSGDNSKKPTLKPGAQAIMLDVPKHAAPPSTLFYRNLNTQKWARFSIGFNNQGAFTTLPPLKRVQFFSKVPKEKDTKPLLSIPPIKPNTSTLLFLTPTGKGSTLWEPSPRLTAVPLTWSDKQTTRVLFVNTSNQAAQVRMSNGTKLVLKSNSTKFIDLPASNKKRVSLMVKGAKDSRITFQESIKVIPDLTKVYALYTANPKTNAGRTIAVYRAAYDNKL